MAWGNLPIYSDLNYRNAIGLTSKPSHWKILQFLPRLSLYTFDLIDWKNISINHILGTPGGGSEGEE